MPFGDQVDEGDLEAELEGMEQEAMDERMLNTGPVPVNTQLDRLPAAGTSDCELIYFLLWLHAIQIVRIHTNTNISISKQRQDTGSRGRRRGGRVGQVAR